MVGGTVYQNASAMEVSAGDADAAAGGGIGTAITGALVVLEGATSLAETMRTPTYQLASASPTVTVAANTCNIAAADAVSSYYAHAEPVTVGSTGQRSFATDSRGTIYFLNAGTLIPAGMAGANVLQ